MKKTFLFFVFILLGVFPVHAGYLTPLNSGIVINEYLLHNNGALTVFTSGLSNPDNCTVVNRVHIRETHVNIEKFTAAIMSAAETGKKVGFYALSCATTHFWGGTQTVPIISDIWIRN